MSDISARLDVGWARIRDTRSFSVTRHVGPEDDIATIEIDVRHLLDRGVAYVGEASVESLVDRVVSKLFTGLVNRVTVHGDVATIELVGNKREFKERLMGGLAVGEGNATQELIFCIMRSNGWPADRTYMQGWAPGPREKFLVAAPLAGASVSESQRFGADEIVLANPSLVAFGESEVWSRFSESQSWAVTAVSADTLYDAEVKGLAQIDVGLSAIRALGAYRFPCFRGGVLPFDRDQARAKVRASDLVLVQSLTSARHWLRSVFAREKLELLEIGSLAIKEIPPEQLEDRGSFFGRSLHEWKMAADSTDDMDRVAHLWRSVECYSSRGVVPQLFSNADLKSIRKVVKTSATWNTGQINAIDSRIGSINNPPLNEKFQMTLDQDFVRLSDQELAAIFKTRDLRNDLEHGRALTEPGHRTLDNAIAVMNFVLVSVLLS
jgi:hypothetical protein